jgi:uncharacterized protein involved in exopolysaccharide biosynthesis
MSTSFNIKVLKREALEAMYERLRAERDTLRAELDDALDNLALANAEIRNLEAWHQAISTQLPEQSLQH